MHGTQKILGFPSEYAFTLNAISTAPGWSELVCGALVAIGLLTRLAAFIASRMSAVGNWLAHGSNGFFPIDNRPLLLHFPGHRRPRPRYLERGLGKVADIVGPTWRGPCTQHAPLV
ncbi:MAG: DoxX family protein [Pseudomonadota bacterium]